MEMEKEMGKRKISKEEAGEIADMLLSVIKMKKKMEEIESRRNKKW